MALPDRIDDTSYRVTPAITVLTILWRGIDAILQLTHEKTLIEEGEF
jgi:hypothetical protein